MYTQRYRHARSTGLWSRDRVEAVAEPRVKDAELRASRDSENAAVRDVFTSLEKVGICWCSLYKIEQK